VLAKRGTWVGGCGGCAGGGQYDGASRQSGSEEEANWIHDGFLSWWRMRLVIPATTVSGCGAISVYTVVMPDVDDLQETFLATTWDLHGFDHMGLAVVHAQTELTGGAGETENVKPCASRIPSGVVAGEAVSRVHSLTWWRRGPR
jgi:hypothetical protein